VQPVWRMLSSFDTCVHRVTHAFIVRCQVELMFVMLKLNHAFVTSMGRLVGVITR
jgi:hypothetical protein